MFFFYFEYREETIQWVKKIAKGKQLDYLLFLFSAEVWLRDLPAWVFGFNLASSFVASSGDVDPLEPLEREWSCSPWSLLM